FTNFLPITLIGVLAYAPVAVLALLAAFGWVVASAPTATSAENHSPAVSVLIGLAFLVALALSGTVANAASLHAVYQVATGRPVDIRRCLEVGFRKLPQCVGVTLLVGGAILLVFIVFSFSMPFLGAAAGLLLLVLFPTFLYVYLSFMV